MRIYRRDVVAPPGSFLETWDDADLNGTPAGWALAPAVGASSFYEGEEYPSTFGSRGVRGWVGSGAGAGGRVMYHQDTSARDGIARVRVAILSHGGDSASSYNNQPTLHGRYVDDNNRVFLRLSRFNGSSGSVAPKLMLYSISANVASSAVLEMPFTIGLRYLAELEMRGTRIIGRLWNDETGAALAELEVPNGPNDQVGKWGIEAHGGSTVHNVESGWNDFEFTNLDAGEPVTPPAVLHARGSR